MSCDSRPSPEWAETGTGSGAEGARTAVPKAIAMKPHPITKGILPLTREFFDWLQSSPRTEWLLQAGPIARQMNEDAKHDPEGIEHE